MKVPNTFCPEQRRPRSAYIHIPFCRHRCGYCNFALVAKRDYLIDQYLESLAIELSWLDDRYLLDTLFIGGGTPSHLSLAQIDVLFKSLGRQFDFEQAEVTIEANPSDLQEAAKVNAFFENGVNRFSLGVQSFSEKKLAQLERDHDEAIVRAAADNILSLTPNLSCDLIFSVMDESLAAWHRDLQTAVELGPAHMSTYELTIEKGTQFWNRQSAGKLKQLDEDVRAEMYETTIEHLNANGFAQYEISSFAKAGYRCEHNQIYWSGLPYFAFGAGASRYVDGIRETNHSSVSNYIKRILAGKTAVQHSEKLGQREAALERLVIGLRNLDGIDISVFENATGFAVSELMEHCNAMLAESGLTQFSKRRLSLTSKGLMVYDSVASAILEQ